MSMDEEAIMELGFTLNEAKVYLSLLKLGPSSVNAIARHSGVHRIANASRHSLKPAKR